MSSNNNNHTKSGIDFQQALSILAARGKEEETRGKAQCPCHAPAARMGQVLRLHDNDDDDDDDENQPTEDQSPSASSTSPSSNHNNNNNNNNNHKSSPKPALLDTFRRLSTRQLLQAVLTAQQERVQTYRNFDQGLQAVLATRNVQYYPTVCTEATAAFCVVADTLQALQVVLQQRTDGDALVALLRTLQQHEQTKLHYTAALHLEQIRLQQEQDINDEKEKDGGTMDTKRQSLLVQSTTALRAQLATCVERINEALQDIQCAVAEAATNDAEAS